MPSKFTPVIVATVVMTGISLFPLLNLINLFCCAGIIIGGFAGTAYYDRQLSKVGQKVQYKDGAAIGILAGIISALIVVMITTIITIIFRENPIPQLFKVTDAYGFHLPAEMERFLEKISDEYNKHGFSITMTLISLGADIISHPLFGAVGGLIGAAVMNRRRK